MGRATLLWGPVLLVFLLAFGGCAGAPLESEAAPTYVSAETSSKRTDLDGADSPEAVSTPVQTVAGLPTPADDAPADESHDDDGVGDEDDTAPSDPYAERAGAVEEPPDEPAFRTWTFLAPDEDVRPVAPAKRPKLPVRARLAVALVRDGVLAYDARPVLDLGNLLAKDDELRGVFALGDASLAKETLDDAVLTLATFAAAAKREGRDLVLVDVIPDSARPGRKGYLLHAATGALLAHFELRPGAEVSASGDADLCVRIAAAFGRLEAK